MISRGQEDTLFRTALDHHKSGRLGDARTGYEGLLKLNPRHADALHHLGVVFLQANDFRRAVDLINKSLERAPRQPIALSNLAYALVKLGFHRKAVHACNKSLQLSPDSAATRVNRANAFCGLGDYEKAEQDYLAALALDPDNAEYRFNLGNALFEQRRFEPAAAQFERAASLAPEMAAVHQNLGATYLALGRAEEALGRFDRVLDATPDAAKAWANRGNALNQLQNRKEAVVSYRKALALDPGLAEAWSSLGITLRDLGHLDEAEASCRRVLELEPGHAVATANLGSVLRDLGRTDEALECFERALALDPHYVDAHRNILLSLTYRLPEDPVAFFAAHRRFEASHARALYAHIRPHRNVPDPDRRLRIGYLSADLRGHSVARNLLSLLRHHDPVQFDIRLYGEVAQPDATTKAFQAVTEGWRSTVGHDDRAVADMIREDGIDILLCLAGRFDLNRPLVAAYRPAPVQISLFDAATSGLEVMDYLISDRTMTPRRTPEKFTERLLCVPHFYATDMPDGLPDVQLRESGPVVFGSLNNPAKVSGPALDLWARLLAQVPESRLVLRYLDWYGASSLRGRVAAALARHGVDPSRVVYPASAGSFAEHMDLYNGIDIALDTFPFSGSTTTFDALAMGVPVVTLPGWNMMSRWTAAMLAAVKLDELVAATPDDFLAIARRLAADAPRRTVLRRTLRTQLAASPLCDGRSKARQFERLYRAVWHRWSAHATKTGRVAIPD